MVCERFVNQTSCIHRLDPRARVLATVMVAVPTALMSEWMALLLCGLMAVVAVIAAHIEIRHLLPRLIALNMFILLLIVTLPLMVGTGPVFPILPQFSRAGLLQALKIGLKAHIILLTSTALLSTVRLVRLGQALNRLGVPGQLAHLFLFTVRYLDVMHHELQRLRTAMAARAFQPRANMQTLRSYGYLIGMLLVRSFERSERVLDAMRCRGFAGRFHSLEGGDFQLRDAVFLGVVFIGVLSAIAMEFIL